MATIKDLEEELAKTKKLVVHVSKENVKLASLLAEVEPALARANLQVKELCSAMDDLTSQKVIIEENFQTAIKMGDEYMSSWKKTSKMEADVSRDLHYEKSRRISAENKLFDLEQRLINTANSEYEPSEVQNIMEGLRIDRHGEIA